MNKAMYYFFSIFMLLIILPIMILKLVNIPDLEPNKNINDTKIQRDYKKNINVLLHEDEKIVQMDLETYIKGVVSAEMPALFEMEALKAQAIAARTYTLYKIYNASDEDKKVHKGADICTNFAHCQAWKSNDELKNAWGFVGYFKYSDKISKAVDQTEGLVIVYENELINPLFHSTSGGKTENSEEVFVTMMPYLRSVESPGEEDSPKFKDSITISFDDFKSKLNQVANGIILNQNDIAKISTVELSEGGRIKKILIGNKMFTGTQIRNTFSLNSTNFEIALKGKDIVINTVGYGHGVGMSQFGANHLAKEGKNFDYIIKHYYKSVDICNFQQ